MKKLTLLLIIILIVSLKILSQEEKVLAMEKAKIRVGLLYTNQDILNSKDPGLNAFNISSSSHLDGGLSRNVSYGFNIEVLIPSKIDKVSFVAGGFFYPRPEYENLSFYYSNNHQFKLYESGAGIYFGPEVHLGFDKNNKYGIIGAVCLSYLSFLYEYYSIENITDITTYYYVGLSNFGGFINLGLYGEFGPITIEPSFFVLMAGDSDGNVYNRGGINFKLGFQF